MCSVVKGAVTRHAACCFSHLAERSPISLEFLASFECRQLGCPQRLSPRLKSKLLSSLMGMRKDSNKTNTTDMRSDNLITSANKNGERAKRSELL